MLYAILLSPLVFFSALFLINKLRKKAKQKLRLRLFTTAMPASWRTILAEQFPLYQRLPKELQTKLEGHINIFLHEKNIIGRNGQLITDPVRVLIAAQACMLILNKATDYYPGFKTILVYPETYVAVVTKQDGMVQSQTLNARAGESWRRGPVVLAWNHVRQGALDSRDGHNVVMHEFAHKLDEENSAMDGLPLLATGAQYRSWAQVFSEEYQRQQKKLLAGKTDVIDSYGASSAAEFFAVVTETFFEKPRQLKHSHPKLYEQLQLFYQLDPLEWELKQRLKGRK